MAEAFGHIANYQELIEAIVGTLVRGDVSADAAQWIAATELEIYRDCNPTPGDQKTTGTLATSAESITLPNKTISIRNVRLDISPIKNLKIANLDRIMDLRESDPSGIPKNYYRYGNILELGPGNGTAATTNYTLWYFGLPDPISPENPTNDIFAIGWDVYLYGALMHSAPYLGDDARIATWSALYLTKKDSLKNAFWRGRLDGTMEQYSSTSHFLSDSHSEN